jgi:hypothetical protein
MRPIQPECDRGFPYLVEAARWEVPETSGRVQELLAHHTDAVGAFRTGLYPPWENPPGTSPFAAAPTVVATLTAGEDVG